MPTYVRSRLLAAREFAIEELPALQANDPAFCPTAIRDLRAIIPFENYVFSGLDLDGCFAGSGILLSTDISMETLSEFGARKLVAKDPLFGQISKEQASLSWFDLSAEQRETVQGKEVKRFFDEHHIAPRLIYTYWNESNQCYGAATFTRQTPFSEEERRLLGWVASRLHKEMQSPVLSRFNQQIGISDGELKCLALASRGLTSQEIGAETGLASETVDSYFKNAAKKLGVKSRAHAIADALRLELIE